MAGTVEIEANLSTPLYKTHHRITKPSLYSYNYHIKISVRNYHRKGKKKKTKRLQENLHPAAEAKESGRQDSQYIILPKHSSDP